MALTASAPLMPSPTFQSAFSPYTDSPNSPSPSPYTSAYSKVMNRTSNSSDKDQLPVPPSPYPATDPPSAVDSNNSHNSTSTDATEIEEDRDADGVDDRISTEIKSPDIEIISPQSGISQESLARIDTAIPARLRADSEDGPQSVIHAPMGYGRFAQANSEAKKSPPLYRTRTVSSPSEKSEATVVSPSSPDNDPSADEKQASAVNTTPLNTSIPPVRPGLGTGATPRASTRQEAEEEWKRRTRASKSLEDITEDEDADQPEEHSADDDDQSPKQSPRETMGQALRNLTNAEHEINTLKTALSECWTLCNTLASLSTIHRERMFSFSGTGDVQEQAWKSCWRLCQKLYESRNEDHATQVRPTLELCRDFCQALFEARQRGDEVTDSVLRVSFELNNHLYNTHDRNLPDAFRERTLDFYLTMCHRLMKQRTSLPEETDCLLRACWSLAEMLFSLRQNNRDNKPPDEELLGSAVQACWELCDLFRDGWTQIRPDRGTPRPVQRVFPTAEFPTQQRHRETFTSNSTYQQQSSYATSNFTSQPGNISRASSSVSLTAESYRTAPPIGGLPPETPTTIFDDAAEMSPDEPEVPNIMVLGTENGSTRSGHSRWSSASSTYSTDSARTSSTATASRGAHNEPEDPHLVRLKAMILKAAMNFGYSRQSPQTFPSFVKAMPSNTFGTLPWQMKLLENYKKLVLTDPTLRTAPPSKRLAAAEVARAVQWMSRSEQYSWMRDCYRLVFGFFPEDAVTRKNVFLQT